jgi:hypothetical protein
MRRRLEILVYLGLGIVLDLGVAAWRTLRVGMAAAWNSLHVSERFRSIGSRSVFFGGRTS